MPILMFGCPQCKKPMGFEYADYDFGEWAKGSEDNFEVLTCECGKKLKVVPWIAVIDEETETPITFV